MEIRDWQEHAIGIGRYFSTKGLFVDHMKMIASTKYGMTGVALDMWFSWVAAELQMEDSATEVEHLPKTGRQYLVSERDCTLQSGQNGF